MPEKKEYSIVYKNECILETGIKVIYSSIIHVTNIEITSGSSCSATTISSIIITTTETITGTLNGVSLNNGVDYVFTDCTINDKTITCSTAPVLIADWYILTEVTPPTDSLISYDVSAVSSIYIRYEPTSSPLADQTSVQSQNIASSSEAFTVLVVDDYNAAPNIYIGNDATKRARCVKDTSEGTKLLCKADDTLMPFSDTPYSIYYNTECGALTYTSIKVTKKASSPIPSIEVDTLSIDTGKTCETTTFSSIKITTKSDITGTSFKATLHYESGDITFSNCSPDNTDKKIITCNQSNDGGSTDTPITIAGTYSLIFLDDTTGTGASQTFTVDKMSTNEIKFVSSPLGDNFSINAQTLTTSAPTFMINIISTTGDILSFYVGNDNTKPITCVRSETATILSCSASNTNMPVNANGYPIYFNSECNTLVETGITVTKQEASPIKVTKISFSKTEDSICTTSDVTQLFLTSEETLSGTIAGSVSGETEETSAIDFSSCSVEDTTITCEITGLIKDDTYTLTTLTLGGSETGLNVDLAKAIKLSYKAPTAVLATQVDPPQIEITSAEQNFDIVVDDNTKPLPLFYIGNDENKVALTCSPHSDESITTKVICATTLDNMPVSETSYAIYYQPACGVLTGTTLRVTKKSATTGSTLTATGIAFSTGTVNTCSTLKQPKIVITCTEEITGTITATIKGVTNPNEITLTNCVVDDITKKTITCDAGADLSVQQYKIFSLSTSTEGTTFNFDAIKDTPLEIKASTLGVQNESSPSLDGSTTTTFKIVLASSDEITVNVFIKASPANIALTCPQDTG